MLVGVDPHPDKIIAGRPSPQTRDWLQAEVNPVIDQIALVAPASVAVGKSAAVSATGSTTGFGLTFPLRFPASVVWSGSKGLAVTTSSDQVARLRREPGTLAALDLEAGQLIAVHRGSVVTVASGGLSKSATVTLG